MLEVTRVKKILRLETAKSALTSLASTVAVVEVYRLTLSLIDRSRRNLREKVKGEAPDCRN